MPDFKTHTALKLGRNIRLFLNIEARLTGVAQTIDWVKSRLAINPVAQPVASKSQAPAAPLPASKGAPVQQRKQQSLAEQNQKLRQVRQKLANKERELAELRTKLSEGNAGAESIGIKPENIIWIFGVARTGSSWLSSIMSDLDKHSRWNEPYVGDVFGYAYYIRASEWARSRKDFILGDPHEAAWLRSIRMFVLDGANARFAGINQNGYLVIKEPNGSTGAPLLMRALPESRMVLLVRDPRDVVASLLAAQRKGSWGSEQNPYASYELSLADENPDEFIRQRAHLYMASLAKAKEAYEIHEGRKILVRYEDLRYETFNEVKKIYSELGVPIEEEQLRQVTEKHAWEVIPEDQKGVNKPRRKAKPGGWKEDLSPEQVRIVEEITAPILEEFYPG